MGEKGGGRVDGNVRPPLIVWHGPRRYAFSSGRDVTVGPDTAQISGHGLGGLARAPGGAAFQRRQWIAVDRAKPGCTSTGCECRRSSSMKVARSRSATRRRPAGGIPTPGATCCCAATARPATADAPSGTAAADAEASPSATTATGASPPPPPRPTRPAMPTARDTAATAARRSGLRPRPIRHRRRFTRNRHHSSLRPRPSRPSAHDSPARSRS